jgi:hypothetical protein
MKPLIRKMIELITREEGELRDIASMSLRDLGEKFAEKLMNNFLLEFKLILEEKKESTIYIFAICIAIYEIVDAINQRVVTAHKDKVLKFIQHLFTNDEPEVQEFISKILILLISKDVENEILVTVTEIFSSNILNLEEMNTKLRISKENAETSNNSSKTEKETEEEEEEDEETNNLKIECLLSIMRLILEKKPRLTEEFVQRFACEPLTPTKIESLTSLLEFMGEYLFTNTQYRRTLEKMIKMLLNQEESDSKPFTSQSDLEKAAQKYLKTCTITIQEENYPKFTEILLEYLSSPSANSQNSTIYNFSQIVNFMFIHSKAKSALEKLAIQYFQSLICFINIQNHPLLLYICPAITNIVNIFAKENNYVLLMIIKQQIENAVFSSGKKKGLKGKLTACIPGTEEFKQIETKTRFIQIFCVKKGLDCILPIVQNTLMHSSLEMRSEAAICYSYIIEFTPIQELKPYATKITGSIIRVVNDKFPPALKRLLLLGILNLQNKPVPLKTFAPPLQTVILKSLNDPSSSNEVRDLAVMNLFKLVQIYPKYDIMINELLNSMTKIPQITGEIQSADQMILLEEQKTAENEKIQSRGEGFEHLKEKAAFAIASLIRLYGNKIKTTTIDSVFQKLVQFIKSSTETPITLQLKAGISFIFANIAVYKNKEQVSPIYDLLLTYQDFNIFIQIAFLLNGKTETLGKFGSVIEKKITTKFVEDPNYGLKIIQAITEFVKEYWTKDLIPQFEILYSILANSSIFSKITTNTKTNLLNILEKWPFIPLQEFYELNSTESIEGTTFEAFIKISLNSLLGLKNIVNSNENNALKKCMKNILLSFKPEEMKRNLASLKQKFNLSDDYNDLLTLL